MAVPVAAHLTDDQCLGWEAQQPAKHWYVSGQILAVVGVTRKHAAVARNAIIVFACRLGHGPCGVYISDMKLRAEPPSWIYYSDVVVTLDPRDYQAKDFMSAAILVTEILSPSTAAYDRGEMLGASRQLASLQENVLIDPERKRIERFRRGESGL